MEPLDAAVENKEKKMAFKKARGYSEEQTKKARRKVVDDNSMGDTTPRAKIRQGLNVYMWLPSMDEREEYYNPEPIRFCGLHYQPFHICGRGDAVIDESYKELVEDRSFKNCKRCLTAWNKYIEEGGKELSDDHPAVKKRKEDLATMRGLIQVVELTPFFELDSTGTEIELKESALAHWPDFLETISTGEVPAKSKMPKEMQESALAGASILVVNKDTGKALAKLHYTSSVKLGKANKKNKEPKSPLMNPERFLLSIIRGEDDSSTFKGRGGKQQKKGTYELEINDLEHETQWEEMCGELLETFEGKEDFEWIDIYTPSVAIPEDTPEDEEIKLVASALIRLSDEELEQLLELDKHSYDYGDESDDDDDDEEESSSRKKLKSKKKPKRRQDDDEEDDEEDDEDDDEDEEPAAFNKFKKPTGKSSTKERLKKYAKPEPEEDDDDDDDDEEEEEETPPKSRRAAARKAPIKKAKAKPEPEEEDDDDDDEEEEETPPPKARKAAATKSSTKAKLKKFDKKKKPVDDDDEDEDDDYYESDDDDDDDDE